MIKICNDNYNCGNKCPEFTGPEISDTLDIQETINLVDIMFSKTMYGNISVSKAEINAKVIYNINWDNRVIKHSSYVNIKKWFGRNLSIIRHQMEPCIRNYAESIRAGPQFDDQMISIGQNLIKDNAIKSRSRIAKSIGLISSEYNRGACILNLADKYNYPASELICEIFKHLRIDAHAESARNNSQIGAAYARDIEVHLAAAKNEAQFVEFFRKCGIKLYDQEAMANDQIIKYGRAIITPDILFIDDVYINGARVTWIEYKDYVGVNDNFLYSYNVAQSKKYFDAFGPGAFCYGKSFVDNMELPNTILLDGTQVKNN